MWANVCGRINDVMHQDNPKVGTESTSIAMCDLFLVAWMAKRYSVQIVSRVR